MPACLCMCVYLHCEILFANLRTSVARLLSLILFGAWPSTLVCLYSVHVRARAPVVVSRDRAHGFSLLRFAQRLLASESVIRASCRMGRMHAPGYVRETVSFLRHLLNDMIWYFASCFGRKGLSQSALPYRRTVPTVRSFSSLSVVLWYKRCSSAF